MIDDTFIIEDYIQIKKENNWFIVILKIILLLLLLIVVSVVMFVIYVSLAILEIIIIPLKGIFLIGQDVYNEKIKKKDYEKKHKK